MELIIKDYEDTDTDTYTLKRKKVQFYFKKYCSNGSVIHLDITSSPNGIHFISNSMKENREVEDEELEDEELEDEELEDKVLEDEKLEDEELGDEKLEDKVLEDEELEDEDSGEEDEELEDEDSGEEDEELEDEELEDEELEDEKDEELEDKKDEDEGMSCPRRYLCPPPYSDKNKSSVPPPPPPPPPYSDKNKSSVPPPPPPPPPYSDKNKSSVPPPPPPPPDHINGRCRKENLASVTGVIWTKNDNKNLWSELLRLRKVMSLSCNGSFDKPCPHLIWRSFAQNALEGTQEFLPKETKCCMHGGTQLIPISQHMVEWLVQHKHESYDEFIKSTRSFFEKKGML
jgi:hypothetical protein